jgi:hypothetical protein
MTEEREQPQYRLMEDPNIGAGWGITEPFRKDRTPAWASVFALLLAIVPGVIDRYRTGHWDSYDPTIAVLTATLIALIWTAHYTYRGVRYATQAREQADLRRRLTRMSIAAAVISELDWLGISLQLIAMRIETKGVRFLDRPQLRHALESVDLFSSATASKLSEFDAVLRQIESHALLYAAEHDADEYNALTHGIGNAGVPVLKRDPQRVDDIRRMIAAAETMMPLLKQQLLFEF